MLLVIFGAGASYDSVPDLPPPKTPTTDALEQHENFRPPLANQLFDNRDIFVNVMEQFRECLAVIPLLRIPGANVESFLAKLQAQAKHFPERHRQLTAIRYYLHSALWRCQKCWHDQHHGITNYKTFLDEVERWRHESGTDVCFVTFNYDTMLDAMQQYLGFELRDFNGYLAQKGYSLIKLQ